MIYDDKVDTYEISANPDSPLLDLTGLLREKSYFLFGPRQTGKTSLVTSTLANVRCYDLLDTSVYLDLSQNPHRLEQELTPRDRFVVIDEIQRMPELLHEVHRLGESIRSTGTSRLPLDGKSGMIHAPVFLTFKLLLASHHWIEGRIGEVLSDPSAPIPCRSHAHRKRGPF
jgi:hypothetical protein